MKEKKQVEITEKQVMESFRSEQLRLNSLKRALAELQANLAEILTTKETLAELAKTKTGEKIMIAIGTGVYVPGIIEHDGNIQFTIGGNVVRKKSIDAALETLEKIRGTAEKQLAQVQRETAQTQANAEQLSQLLIQAQRLRQAKPQL